MGRTVTEHEMDRRRAMAEAQSKITNAMSNSPNITPLEWCHVLNQVQQRMIAIGLREEFED